MESNPSAFQEPDATLIQAACHILDPLRRYHRHAVVGLEHIPHQGPALLVVNHSFASYDGFLLALAIYERTGRVSAALGDDLIFRLPRLGPLARALGIYPASPASGQQVLGQGRLLMLAPGGMREALRPSTERYRLWWQDRLGFVRLALRTGAPIVLAACPAADDIFTVYDSRVTRAAYRYLKVPLPLVRGFGPSLLPRPVSLTHYLAAPLRPPSLAGDEAAQEEQVTALHRQVVADMAALMQQHSGRIDRVDQQTHEGGSTRKR